MTIQNNLDDSEKTTGPTLNQSKKIWLMPISLALSTLVLGGAWVYTASLNAKIAKTSGAAADTNLSQELTDKVLPTETILPVSWTDLGVKLVQSGTLDLDKFQALYEQRGGLDESSLALLEKTDNGQIKMTPNNAGLWLNLLWALGLGTKNEILDQGPMSNPKYGGAGNFASTGGWTIAKGETMNHFSQHNFFTLTEAQEALVIKVAQNIYRPCCGNSTIFPDCNHGLAMLGLMELMASQNATAEQMYQAALVANSYWFPDTYLTIAKYFDEQGKKWAALDPREILSATYSSSQGYNSLVEKTAPVLTPSSTGRGCGL